MPKIVKCSDKDYATLSKIWERSVRNTHDFIDENTIAEIKEKLSSCYFPNVNLYAVNVDGSLVGFMGLFNDKIEMLFVDSNYQKLGFGSMLIDFAKQNGATKVDVNEQNPTALKFYLSKKFRIISRDDTDEDGRPYPILHLLLQDTNS